MMQQSRQAAQAPGPTPAWQRATVRRLRQISWLSPFASWQRAVKRRAAMDLSSRMQEEAIARYQLLSHIDDGADFPPWFPARAAVLEHCRRCGRAAVYAVCI